MWLIRTNQEEKKGVCVIVYKSLCFCWSRLEHKSSQTKRKNSDRHNHSNTDEFQKWDLLVWMKFSGGTWSKILKMEFPVEKLN